ncbi:MAG: 4'-phosphopantetheinyl transferase superfamily protein [Terracidiphilus sp.]
MTEESLREIVSTLSRIDGGQLTAESPLTGPLTHSLGRARLDANLRSRFGIANPAIYSATTFGELCSVLGVAPASNAAEPAVPFAPVAQAQVEGAGSGIRIGTDVESITAMPTTADYWEDEFYKSTFTPREIGYALLQPSPQASFAAMWCAKEAVRKADPSLAQVDWQKLEVIHDDRGKPGIALNEALVPGSLSVSHTDEIAFAVFAFAPSSNSVHPSDSAPKQEGTGSSVSPEVASQGHVGRNTAMLAALALLLSIAALALSFLRR